MICDQIEQLAVEYCKEAIATVSIEPKLSTDDADRNRIIVECVKEGDEVLGYVERLKLTFRMTLQAGEQSESLLAQAMAEMTSAFGLDPLKAALISSEVVCVGILPGEVTSDASYPIIERTFSFTVFASAI